MLRVVDAIQYPTSEETSPSLVAVVAAVDIARYPFRGQTSPDGSMTVVFTDVEGSTGMLERLGEERWLKVIRDHNRLVRERVAAHDGVVVKSQGDGFMLIFSSASAALASAVELQEVFSVYNIRLADEPLERGLAGRERKDLHGLLPLEPREFSVVDGLDGVQHQSELMFLVPGWAER